jgi:peptide/nickel transport system permease protein
MSPRVRFILRRVLLTIPVLFAMSIFVFLMIHLVPGDPVQTMLGIYGTPARVATIRAELGFNRPLVDQYFSWLGGVLHGNLGEDFISHQPLSHLLGQRLPVTIELTVLAMLLALGLGIPLGVIAAVGPRWAAGLADLLVVGGVSIPGFWLGIMLVLVFTAWLHLLPPEGYVPFTADPVSNLRFMILPVLALSAAQLVYILRTTKAAMVTVLGSPYITFLRAKGIGERRIVFVHALRNASIPIITVIGIQFGALLGGAIIIEQLFAVPGVGQLVVNSIFQRNYTVVQGSVLVIAVFFILVNLITDLIYGLLDPRVADTSSGR